MCVRVGSSTSNKQYYSQSTSMYMYVYPFIVWCIFEALVGQL